MYRTYEWMSYGNDTGILASLSPSIRMSVSFPQDTHRYDIFNHKYSLNTKTKMEYGRTDGRLHI